MSLPSRPCAHCIHWRPASPTAYRAPCAVGYGQPAHDDTCDAHTPFPAPAQQSQARGVAYEMWQKTQGKP